MSSGTVSISLKVLRGRDLISKDSNGFSDPYIKAYILKADGKKDNKSKKKLPIRKKTLNPDWSEEAPIEYTVAAADLRSISLTCWDSDFGRNDFMGEILLTKEKLLSIEGSDEDWYALQPMAGQKGDVSGGLLVQLTVSESGDSGTPGKKAKKSRFGLFKKSKSGATSSSSVDDCGEGEVSPEGSQSAEASQESEEPQQQDNGEAREEAPAVTPVEQLEEEEENDGVGEDIAPADGKVRLRIKYDPTESDGTLFVKLLECQDLDVPGELGKHPSHGHPSETCFSPSVYRAGQRVCSAPGGRCYPQERRREGDCGTCATSLLVLLPEY